MSNKNFVHLHCHTHISIQDALPTPEQYAIYAREMGFPAAAITDHGRMGGIVQFVDNCRKPYNDLSPIKPIIGIEIYVAKDRTIKTHEERTDGTKGRPKYNHLTMIAKNLIGYKNLLKLSTMGHENFYYDPKVDWELIQQYSEGIIVLSGCLGSEVSIALRQDNIEEAERIMRKYKEVFENDYYAEFQYHGIPEQKRIIPKLIELAKKLDIKPVVSNDVHYLKSEDFSIHNILIQMRNMAESKKSGTKTNGKLEAYDSHQFYLKSYDQMFEIFGKLLPKSLQNTVEIAEKVEDFFQIDVPSYEFLPKASLPVENEDFIKFWHKFYPYNEQNEAYLAYLSIRGLRKMGLENKEGYMTRLRSELKTIWYGKVTDYILIQYEIANFMKEQDIVFGIRGSGVSSLINYCLEISALDPIEYGLMFERFLNPGRGVQYKIDYSCLPVKQWVEYNSSCDESVSLQYIKKLLKEKEINSEDKSRLLKELWVLENQGLMSYMVDLIKGEHKTEYNESQLLLAYILGITKHRPDSDLIISKMGELPDIDTDIQDDRRIDVINFVKNRFGEKYVCQIGTRGTYAARASVVGALKVSAKFNADWGTEYDKMAHVISKLVPFRPKVTITDALKEVPEFKQWATKYPKEIEHAQKLQGTISHLGVHAAGIIISAKPIDQHTPLEMSKDGLCTGFDMNDIVRTGLIKYDFLGLSSYRMIYIALKLIEERHQIKINLMKIPLKDKNVYKLYNEGKTSTVFQCGKPGMKNALKTVGVSTFEDITAVISLYRPGPLEYIDVYAKGKVNPGSVKFDDELIKKHLESTYGIMVYQEQAMFLAREMAGLTWGEVDKLRKAISKKQSEAFVVIRKTFSNKAKARGVPEKSINSVLDLMEKFGGYAFNKCIIGDTILTNADNGNIMTVEELYNSQNKFNIHSLNESNLKIETSPITDVIYNGIKPVWELTTKQGYKIITTVNHPFYTMNGWKNLEDLQIGDYIGVARNMDIRNYEYIKHNKKGFRRTTITKIAEYFNSKELKKYGDSDIYWDTISSIEFKYQQKTYDLTVEPHHNFIANGIIVHNSHATSYALVSYWTAWLRTYYPYELMAAAIEVDHSSEEKMYEYKAECAKDGIIIKRPNINESTMQTSITEDNKIILPLTSIKGVGDNAKIIVANQPYTSLIDLAYRARPNKGLIQSLAESNALKILPDCQNKDWEDIMQEWEITIKQRDIEEKEEKKLAKQKFIVLSPMTKHNDNKVTTNKKPKFFNESVFDEE